MRSLALALVATLLRERGGRTRRSGTEDLQAVQVEDRRRHPPSPVRLHGTATLVVFFFPTCGYCNASFPAVQTIYDSYKDRGLAMVWINAVPEEDRLVKDWQARHGYTVPILVGASQAALQRDYDLTTTPTHYLLGANRTVLFAQAGYWPGDEAELERAIVRALEPPP
jgi:hypothetical protein